MLIFNGGWGGWGTVVGNGVVVMGRGKGEKLTNEVLHEILEHYSKVQV